MLFNFALYDLSLLEQTAFRAERAASTDGTRGAPRFAIERTQLEFLCGLNFTVPEMAKIFQVSGTTIERRLR